jgi:hypothetical protein
MLWCYATAGVTFRYDRFSIALASPQHAAPPCRGIAGTPLASFPVMTSPAESDRSVGLRAGGAIELEPEAVLPSQYFSLPGVDASLQAEKRLMLAVLEDAVGTFQKYVNAKERNGQRLFTEVEDWFAADEVEWPYSFINISQALGLDPEYLRGGLNHWKDVQRRTPATGSNVVRFPFRRVNGSRHMITGRAAGLRRSA